MSLKVKYKNLYKFYLAKAPACLNLFTSYSYNFKKKKFMMLNALQVYQRIFFEE